MERFEPILPKCVGPQKAIFEGSGFLGVVEIFFVTLAKTNSSHLTKDRNPKGSKLIF